MIVPLVCDERGFVRGFPYHDGFLDGVLTDGAANTVHFSIRSSDGERRVLTLRGVVALDVTGFREGNVLLNVRLLSTVRAARDPEVRRWLIDRLLLDPEKLQADASVFVIESSFGAQVVAVYRDGSVADGAIVWGTS